MNLSQVKAITIPEGAVKQIIDGLGRVLWSSGPIVDYTEPFYVEGYNGSAITLSILKSDSQAPDIPVEYSFDKTTWQSLGTTSTTALTINIPAGGKVWLRATANKWCNSDFSSRYWYNYINANLPYNVGGNIMSLLYGSNFIGTERVFPSSEWHEFSHLFYDSVSGYGNLYSASNLLLPARTLMGRCYSYMFYGNTNLIDAPVLPATTLTDMCYEYMFRDCTSLTQAPELPATTLAVYCYNNMFRGCTSLTQAPELPATTPLERCYQSMFYGCTSLTTVHDFPMPPNGNISNGSYCYGWMFSGCTSLVHAPALPATNFNGSGYCYYHMFDGCTALTQAPALPATHLNGGIYDSMFKGCTALTQAPALPATSMYNFCYQYMFQGCTALTQAPVLPATTLADYCYQCMFKGCTNLNYIKALFTTTPSSSYTFDWVDGVAATGTFVKNANATWEVTGADGVPTGWTIQTE